MKKITTLFVALIAVLSTQAQVVNVCGTDSIFLQVENYDGLGVIEWQESIDLINWVTIPEIVGEMYKFFPTQTKYYRAVVKTSSCAPLYSAISFVQLVPQANAGTDKITGGTKTTLLGNKITGANGLWTILAGTNGVLSEPTNPYSEFSGIYNQVYQLVWTVTNACGQSSDTVKVQFEEIVANNNFIVVDNTDSLYSDSTEMTTGSYRIKFSDPTIAPTDSVVLIGMRENLSFLRKVISFSLRDSIYSFTTIQGTLQDLFKSGTINIGDAINQGILTGNTTQGNKIKGINIFPTRQTLKNYANKKEMVLIYSDQNFGGNRIKTENLDNMSVDKIISIPIPTKSILELENSTGSLKVTLEDFYLQLTPNFVSQFSVWPFSFKFGLDNAIMSLDYTTKYEITGSFSKEDTIHLVKPPFKRSYWFTIPPCPIPINTVLNINVDAVLKIGVEAGITVTKKDHYTNNFTATIEAKKIDIPDFSIKSNETSTSSIQIASALNAGLHGELTIGPEINLMLFDIVGPYVKTPVKMELDIKANTDKNWSGEYSIGLKGLIGAKAEIKKTIFYDNYSLDYYFDLWGDKLTYKYKLPNKLVLLSGDTQKGQAGQALPNPITFLATNTNGFGVPFVPVRFELESGNGSVQSNVIYTDILGQVSVNWNLGSNAESKLKAYVLDYENIDIDGSPIYVTAYSSGVSNSCENSNLAITMKTTSTYKYPSVIGGTAPYTYSTNGINYSSTVPQFNISTPGNYTIYVKDKNQCSIVRSFTISSTNPCDNTDLTMDIYTVSNTVSITGKKGTAPYLYAIENQTNYTANNFFSNLTVGYHLVFVKDSKGCIISSDVKIESNTIAAIRSSYPTQGATSVPLNGIKFQWTAATYTSNQLYDLYLKKGTDTYNLIASNLSTTSFTYSTALLASTAYIWKVVVKIGSTEIDHSEFTFTTASGVTSDPIEPVLLHPSSGTSVYSSPTFRWTPQSSDFIYDFYLDTKNATSLVALNLTSAEYTLNNLVSGKTYYWKVRIKNRVTGKYSESEIRSFSFVQKGNFIGSISGKVFNDINLNSKFDSGIDKLQSDGYLVLLNGSVSMSMRPNVDGTYNFSGLPAGKYYITLLAPTYWTTTLPLNGSKYQIDLSDNEKIINKDFANFYLLRDNSTPEIIVFPFGTQTGYNDRIPMSTDSPQQTPPINQDNLPSGTRYLTVSSSGFFPSNFYVKKNEIVLLALTSTDQYTHVMMFDSSKFSAVAIGVGPGETRMIAFKIYDVNPGEIYTLRCDVPGHAGRGEIARMIILD